MSLYGGRPWEQQFLFNEDAPTAITTWTNATDLLPNESGVSYQNIPFTVILARGRVWAFSNFSAGGYVADINSSGIIGTFSSAYISMPVIGGAIFATENYIYILGGESKYNLGTPITTVNRSSFDVNNDLNGFENINLPIPLALCGLSAIVVEDIIYLLGGSTVGYSVDQTSNTNLKDTVYAATLDSNEAIGTWALQSSFTMPAKSAWGSIALTGPIGSQKIHYIGGVKGADNSSGNDYVISTDSNGDLTGSWGYAPYQRTYTDHFDASAVAVSADSIYLIGGHKRILTPSYSCDKSIDVYRAPLDTSGNISGAWTAQEDLTYAKGPASSVITSSRLYVFGENTTSADYRSALYTSYSGGFDDYRDVPLTSIECIGTIEQELSELSGTALNPIQSYGNVIQEEAQILGELNTPIQCYGDINQDVSSVAGYIYLDDGFLPNGIGDVTQELIVAQGLAVNNSILGNVYQEEVENSGIAENPLACFSDVRKYLTRSNGTAYVGDLIVAADVYQEAPNFISTAFTWNIGNGVSDQDTPLVSGEATTISYLAGDIIQDVPLSDGLAYNSSYILGNVSQPSKQVTGRMFSLSVCNGNVFQPIHKVHGKTLTVNQLSIFEFFRCETFEVPLSEASNFESLSFFRCSNGIPISICRGNVYQPINKAQGIIDGNIYS